MHIGRHLVLNTAHIRCATAVLLETWSQLPAVEQPVLVASTQYGWFVATGRQQPLPRTGLPSELIALLEFGAGEDCSYVLLDCDGPTESVLACFPW